MPVHSIIKIAILSQVLLWSQSCYYDNEEDLYGDMPCDTSDVTYSGTIEPMIQSTCAVSGCHVAGGSANGLLETYNNVKAKVDNGSMYSTVVDQRTMPPGSPLDDCQVLLFEQWISDGAPNN